MFYFRRITVFCLGCRLSKQKTTRYAKHFLGEWPPGPPPGYAYGQERSPGPKRTNSAQQLESTAADKRLCVVQRSTHNSCRDDIATGQYHDHRCRGRAPDDRQLPRPRLRGSSGNSIDERPKYPLHRVTTRAFFLQHSGGRFDLHRRRRFGDNKAAARTSRRADFPPPQRGNNFQPHFTLFRPYVRTCSRSNEIENLYLPDSD